MIKRANKITALVISATSLISPVPAMASERLGTKDGTIENAVSFKDGKYIYEGYRTEDDDSGLYYNGGDKDKQLDDATQLGSTLTGTKFDDKYVAAFDGSDEYIVDLSTGKISDEDTVTDLTDTAKIKLTNKLKKTDRYTKVSGSNFGQGGSYGEVALGDRVNNNRFGDVWFEYSATTSQAITVAKAFMASQVTTSQAVYYGYTNSSGTYIDTSYKANIYVYNGTNMVKIENVGDEEGGIKLNSIIPITTLGQDDKYIYRVVSANISGLVKKIKKTSGPDSVTYNGTDYNSAGDTLYYVQKIAKTQGDKEEDAYLPNSTDSYEISGATGNSDVMDAYIAIQKVISHTDNAIATIVDGVIYITYDDDEKVKTEKLVLKNSEKLNLYTNDTKLDTKVDGHVAKKDDDQDTKANSWSIDFDGNIWAIYNGEIKKSTKIGNFETIYTCDRSFDKLDVYDQNNLIAWEDGGGAYTTVQEGTAVTNSESTPVAPAKTGWDQLADGTWNFYDTTGAKVVNNWINVGGTWYYLKADGVMATGWLQVGGALYYLNPISNGTKGAMKTGWLNDNGTWYFLQSSGAMKIGWINDNGTWYYLYSNGAMAANTVINGYRLSSSGALI